ncbi:MPN338 family protein [Mycoplasma amphoriforme]
MSNKKWNNLTIRNIYPFYVDNINDKFFVSLNNHPNKKFVNKVLPKIQKNLVEEELEKFIEIDNLTKNEKVALMLNLALKKIASKTGSVNNDIFKVHEYDRFKEPLYIRVLDEDKEIELVSDNQSERRFNFIIDINPTSYLYSYMKSIRLSFYLDEETKILSGGFSLTLTDQTSDNLNFEEVVNNVYLSTLIRHYIIKQLYPLSLNNILDLISNYELVAPGKSKRTQSKPTFKKNNLEIDFKSVTANDLKANWSELIKRKYLKFSTSLTKEEMIEKTDGLFFSILIGTMINLSLYEELKIYFTSQKPELILNILDKPSQIKEDPNQNPEQDFFELGRFLKASYFRNDILKKHNLSKLKSFEDVFSAISEHQTTIDYESFSQPIPIFDVQISNNAPFVSSKKMITEDMNTRLLYLLTTSPELFGMDLYSSFFIDYAQLLNVLEKNRLNTNVSNSFKAKIEASRAEINNNYVTYMSGAPAILLLKNEKIDIFKNYLWAEIYAQSKIWIKNDIEHDFNNQNLIKTSQFYHDKINALERLSFDWYDDFYGLSEIREIVKKIDSINNLKKSIDALSIKLKQNDSLVKKDRERKMMVYAFVVASIIGFINFFGMVFTVLTVNDVNAGLTTVNLVIIGIASALAFTLLSIIIYFVINLYKSKELKNQL